MRMPSTRQHTLTTPPVCHNAGKISVRTIALQHQTSHRKNTRDVCLTLLLHLERFAGREVKIKEVDELFIRNFVNYLLNETSLKTNSIRTYLQKFHAILEEAVRIRLLPYNPMPPIGTLIPHITAPTRAFLTSSEILCLSSASCRNPVVKSAFLFACFTGLRLSDIESLRWEHLQKLNGVLTIVKVQQKTQSEIRIPLNKEALHLLPLTNRREGHVFDLPSRSTIASALREWGETAGIDKKITFHVSRHSFATLLLTAGVEIYTVSKLCGHRDVRTTEIYAHIIDSTLHDGVNRVSTLFRASSHRLQPANNTLFRIPSQ